MRRGFALGCALAATAGLGCFNQGSEVQVVGAGHRLELVIETGRTDVEGTHFLIDTATGDLWRLDARASGPERWVRVSDGPSDLRVLTPEELGFPVPPKEDASSG